MPPLLREDPRFRRFWLGQTISLVGDQVSLIALPLVAVPVLDADAAQMGYLVAAELAPYLLFSLHAGAWADRRGRRRQTMIASDLGRALVIGSVPVAYAFDVLTFAHLLPSPVLRLEELPENGEAAPEEAAPADRVGRV